MAEAGRGGAAAVTCGTTILHTRQSGVDGGGNGGGGRRRRGSWGNCHRGSNEAIRPTDRASKYDTRKTGREGGKTETI